MAKILVEYSNRLQQAVDSALQTPSLSVSGGRRERGRNALTDTTDSAQYVYKGYFKVVDASETKGDGKKTLKVKVVDGGNPDSPICGQTDLGSVEKKTVAFDALPKSGTSPVYLLVKYESGKYNFSFQIGGDVPVSPTGFCVLADINPSGVIRQIWTDGVIYFSDRYYT